MTTVCFTLSSQQATPAVADQATTLMLRPGFLGPPSNRTYIFDFCFTLSSQPATPAVADQATTLMLRPGFLGPPSNRT
ncbi:hypothetical protein T265_07260 [Opisthorchis viverrini]|uniref:Uncharacterized protein n=1 Tax=Opisthorchis viverrini TaxID=6198 RepID=A0A074ZDH1_OPIVI|nr:hypothetical protein T265_07260 [Opisthorchis viverrini]KER25218.1 hypothetical protein T265_07260 [Opisthorchis viverrini]